jgi:hypothetical protein
MNVLATTLEPDSSIRKMTLYRLDRGSIPNRSRDLSHRNYLQFCPEKSSSIKCVPGIYTMAKGVRRVKALTNICRGIDPPPPHTSNKHRWGKWLICSCAQVPRKLRIEVGLCSRWCLVIFTPQAATNFHLKKPPPQYRDFGICRGSCSDVVTKEFLAFAGNRTELLRLSQTL